MSIERDWNDSDIAVIGMAGRFPGATNVQTFWQNLCGGVESIRVLEQHELEALGVDAATSADQHYVRAAAVMDGIEQFDAAFFGYTPREAELMDPQHRLFLECAWETLEHAGYDPDRYDGAIGVYGGGTTNTYLIYNLLSNRATLSAFDPMQIDVSNASDFVATRVSYKLNLKGPSFTVQTACSTSMVAIHMACQSLINEECDMALAGGVSVHVKHPEGYWYQDGGNVSPDGHCRAFDADGAGTIFGSGVASVLLKRLGDAVADGDHIHAVVKGSAINNDGAHKVGFTAPSVDGQAQVITEALALAGIKPGSIRYVETHGTATKLGDPVEIRALTKAFRTQTNKNQYCAVGSVKTNVGHLASAAGVTSFIKTVLMLEHQQIPPSLHYRTPNPEIDFASSPFYVSAELSPWVAGKQPRRAGVSSFGVGGTNAHAVLEEAPALPPSSSGRPWQLLVLSAKTPTALETMTDNLGGFLQEHRDLTLADAAYTLQVGRQVFGHRRIVVCNSTEDASSAIACRDTTRTFTGTSEMQDRPVAFLFPGMGDQYVQMASGLYRDEPTFRAALDRCAAVLQPILGQDIRKVLYPADQQAPATSNGNHGQLDLRQMLRRTAPSNEPIHQTALAHPILFSVQYALAQVWQEWGIAPAALLGQSIGEYVAACLAGVFSLEDALLLVSRRARMIQELPGGAVLAVLLPEDEILPLLDSRMSIGAVNAPHACVVSGETDAIAGLERHLLARGVACQRVQTTHAFHSAMMAPLEGPLTELVGQMRLNAPRIPFLSNVTGDWITAEEATDPAYWARHMRQTARVSDGIGRLLARPEQVLLELGSGQTLTALAKQHTDHTSNHLVLASLRQSHQQQDDQATLLHTLGRLWIAGVTIDWGGVARHERRHRVVLPGYPFERQRYWVDASDAPDMSRPALAPTATQRPLDEWFLSPTWRRGLPLPAPAEPARRGPWLIFTDDFGFGRTLAQQLEQSGETVVQVRRAGQFARVDATSYTIDLRQPEQYTALLHDLHERALLPETVLHAASLIHDPPTALDADTFRETQDYGLSSLAFLVQALDANRPRTPLALLVVSNYVHQIESADALHPARATILSPVLVIPQEYPHIACRYIDVTLSDAPSEQARLARQVMIEAGGSEPVVAYRGRNRWVPQLAPLQLPAEQADTPLRHGGTYAITEGLVGVGWALAQLLARDIQPTLVLIEQTPFPAQSEWAARLVANDPGDPISRKIARLRTLQEYGATVHVVSADGSDAAKMRDALAQARQHTGALHGVIHTLGSIGGEVFSPLQETSAATIDRHLLPTFQQVAALAGALEGETPDFCMLTSSLSSVLGGLGQATHAAASLLLGALADHQTQHSDTPWLCVDWDVWQPEGEQAEAMQHAALTPYLIAPQDGVEAARRLLNNRPGTRVVVSTGDLALRQAQQAHAIPQEAIPGGMRAQHPRPQLSTPFVAARTDLEQTIARTWQDIFGLEQIGIDDNFFELGGNSLIAIHTMTRLKKTLQVDVPTAMLYQRPTIRFLAELLAQDEDAAAQEMAERLAKRKADLGRRNQMLQRRR